MANKIALQVNGAYGRRYATAQAALADWDAGKDFQIMYVNRPAVVGAYCSQRDNFGQYGYTHVQCIVGGDGFATLWEGGA